MCGCGLFDVGMCRCGCGMCGWVKYLDVCVSARRLVGKDVCGSRAFFCFVIMSV
jgi:hypothetical protein